MRLKFWIFIFFSVNLYSQDTLFLKDGNILSVNIQSVDNEITKYKRLDNIEGPIYSIITNSIKKIRYYDGGIKEFSVDQSSEKLKSIDEKVSATVVVDSVFTKCLFFKINFTNTFLNQASVAIERQLTEKRIIEVEVNYNFATPGAPTAEWKYNLHFNEEGFEIKPGIGLVLSRFKKSSFLLGANLSYRYSHISNAIFMIPYSEQLKDKGVYRMSQTRNLAGLFVKATYRLRYKKTGFDFFVQPGCYVGHNKNTYFEYKPQVNGSNQVWRTDNIPPITTWYMKSGTTILPYLNVGASLRMKFLNKQEKIERKLSRNIDSSFKIKDAIKLNISSLLACKLGLTYEKVFKSRYSWEFEPSFIFPNPIYDAVTQFFWPNVWFKNQGFELKTGINVLLGKTGRRRKIVDSHGLFLSYRYTHNDNVYYWTGGISGSSYHSLYKISQTKNLIGLTYKRSFFNALKKTSFVPFYEFGFYYGFSRTVCFYDNGGYSNIKKYPMTVYNVGLPFENGYVFIPVARIGFNIRCGIGNNK
jgi:hypothetical protein